MLRTTTEDKEKIARSLFGKTGTFKAFFNLYDELAVEGTYIIQLDEPNQPNPLEHQNIVKVVNFLKDNPGIKLDEVKYRLKTEDDLKTTSDPDIKRAIKLAVQCMMMVDSEAKDGHSPGYTLGGQQPTLWLGGETFLEFAKSVFPRAGSVSSEVKTAIEEHATMRAWNMQKRLGRRFKKTDSLAEHLLFDDDYIYLFHHTSFLKAQLERFQDEESPLNCDMADCLSRGKLPPQLLIESLHSLQAIIFPPMDERSTSVLDDLIEKERFDVDCANYEGYKGFQGGTPEYLYWGERIAALHEMLKKTPKNLPHTKLERWLERHSSERNALIVALVALLITILTGIVSIGLAAFQAWIAWMAWKHPTSPRAKLIAEG